MLFKDLRRNLEYLLVELWQVILLQYFVNPWVNQSEKLRIRWHSFWLCLLLVVLKFLLHVFEFLNDYEDFGFVVNCHVTISFEWIFTRSRYLWCSRGFFDRTRLRRLNRGATLFCLLIVLVCRLLLFLITRWFHLHISFINVPELFDNVSCHVVSAVECLYKFGHIRFLSLFSLKLLKLLGHEYALLSLIKIDRQ